MWLSSLLTPCYSPHHQKGMLISVCPQYLLASETERVAYLWRFGFLVDQIVHPEKD